jgi:hypothetical protein
MSFVKLAYLPFYSGENAVSYLTRSLCLVLFFVFFLSDSDARSVGAQSQNASSMSSPLSKPKGGQEACDGALDIVPSKAATFMRKRRLSAKKPVTKPEPKAETKTPR